jgi:uncharacterized alpha-E superfamily protein
VLTSGTALHAVFETAAALERAEASARVLAARAAGYAGAPRAFAELAAIAPDGLIPTPGRGAAHVARQIEHAADTVCDARALLGDEVVDAVEWAAGMTRRIASTADALDPTGAARAARRGVATVRGLVDGTVDRDERWEAFRLGTFMPRSAWISALIRAAATVSAQNGNDQAWRVAGAVTGLGADGVDIAQRLISDRQAVATAAHALEQTESALLSLQRMNQVSTAALPLAREAHSRLREASTQLDHPDEMAHTMDRVLDAIGALAGAVDPTPLTPRSPGHSPSPGFGRPLSPTGTMG